MDNLHQRISRAEDRVRRIQAAPTVPIIDPANQPQDPIAGQIAIGLDDSINWYDGTNWNTHAASNTTGVGPQDPLEGQIAIGSDNSLCWYSNGAWHGAAGRLATADGSLPQDPLEGQLVVGTNSIIWFSNGDWYGFVFVIPTGPVPALFVTGVVADPILHPIIANTDYLFEFHTILSTRLVECFINGSSIFSITSSSFTHQGLSFYFNDSSTGALVPTSFYYIWDIKVGTTRGATDIFVDSLTSVPTSPPWDHVANDSSGGINGFDTATHNSRSVIKATQFGNVFGHEFDLRIATLADIDELWFKWNMNFSPEFLNQCSLVTPHISGRGPSGLGPFEMLIEGSTF